MAGRSTISVGWRLRESSVVWQGITWLAIRHAHLPAPFGSWLPIQLSTRASNMSSGRLPPLRISLWKAPDIEAGTKLLLRNGSSVNRALALSRYLLNQIRTGINPYFSLAEAVRSFARKQAGSGEDAQCNLGSVEPYQAARSSEDRPGCLWMPCICDKGIS